MSTEGHNNTQQTTRDIASPTPVSQTKASLPDLTQNQTALMIWYNNPLTSSLARENFIRGCSLHMLTTFSRHSRRFAHNAKNANLDEYWQMHFPELCREIDELDMQLQPHIHPLDLLFGRYYFELAEIEQQEGDPGVAHSYQQLARQHHSIHAWFDHVIQLQPVLQPANVSQTEQVFENLNQLANMHGTPACYLAAMVAHKLCMRTVNLPLALHRSYQLQLAKSLAQALATTPPQQREPA